MPKRYNTPHRSHVVKTRLTDEEYADFTERLAPYGISQSEFLRQAIRRTTIRPVLHVSSVNDELLSAVGKLTAEYGRIGGNLNQIARTLNEWHKPSRMDYRQHQAARRLVHECCNYDEGNCLLLDDGEPCVCVQSISYSLMCRWFRVAVLPLDGELAAALLYRGSRKRCAVCGAAFVPKSNRGKYCPGCAGCMKKRKAAERKRKQRQKCHALEPFKPA